MTAPAIIDAPITQEGTHGVEDAIASITKSAIDKTMAETTPGDDSAPVDTAPADTGRDEKGRFTPKEEPNAETPAFTADPVEAEPEPVAFPDGFVAVPKITRELAMPFKVMDADGELDIPDFQVEFTANGKTRKESLDKVVKLASFGVYNEERQQQIEASRQESARVTQQSQQLLSYVKQLEAEREALLSDDTAYLTARAKHEQSNTPEARMQRLQDENAQQHHRMEFQQAAQTGQQFFASELSPAVEQISRALPTVSPEEIGASLLLVADRFKVHTPFGSIIPPSAYQALRQAMLSEVVPWAQQLHEHRDHQQKASSAKTETEKQALKKAAETAQVSAQKAKSLVGKVGKPSGKASADTPPPKPIRTVDDAESSALDATMAAMGMRRAG
jgi:hypothetical protein